MKLITDSQWKAHQGLIADLKRQLVERDAEVKSLTGQLSQAEQKADDLNEKLIDVEHNKEVQAHRQAQKGEPQGAQKHVHGYRMPREDVQESRYIREVVKHSELLADSYFDLERQNRIDPPGMERTL